MTKRRFSDLSARNRKLLVVLSSVQVAMNLAAQLDITRRTPSELNGSKTRWRLVSLINIFGPLAYFRWGRLAKH